MKKVIIHRKAHGFTLIELLVAIGIVLLLMTIGIIGMRKMTEQARRRTTEQLVANCRGLFSEYERATLLRPLEGAVEPGSNSLFYSEPRRAGIPMVYVSRQAPEQPLKDDVVTRLVMRMLTGLPVSNTAVEQMPPEQVSQPLTPGGGKLILDGWSNAIIFVPPGGLTGVRAGSTTRTITSPDGKAFFASAGPDGSFAEGADNIYSFER